METPHEVTVRSTGDNLELVSEVSVPWSPSLEESELNWTVDNQLCPESWRINQCRREKPTHSELEMFKLRTASILGLWEFWYPEKPTGALGIKDKL